MPVIQAASPSAAFRFGVGSAARLAFSQGRAVSCEAHSPTKIFGPVRLVVVVVVRVRRHGLRAAVVVLVDRRPARALLTARRGDQLERRDISP